MKNVVARHKAQLGLAAASVLVAAGLLVANSSAIAQPADGSAPQITVTGSRVVKQTIGRSATTGAAIEVVKIGREVSYGDLNLSTHAGVTKLEDRVKATAKDLCEELNKLYPLEPKDPECVAKATDAAMNQVKAAADAASK